MPVAQKQPDSQLESFLRELTDLSRKYEIGITDQAEVFIMENDDSNLVYICDADGKLAFLYD